MREFHVLIGKQEDIRITIVRTTHQITCDCLQDRQFYSIKCHIENLYGMKLRGRSTNAPINLYKAFFGDVIGSAVA